MSQENHVNESIINEEVKEFLEKGKRTDHMKYLPDMEAIQSDVMDKVREAARNYDYSLYTEADVRRALSHDYKTPEDFKALLSPAALPLLEEIAQCAQKETRKHFGNSIYMFTPVYIANYCENYCIYCGFNCHNRIKRAQLTYEEIDKEMAAIAKSGLSGDPDPDRREPEKIHSRIYRRGMQDCQKIFQSHRPGGLSYEF